MDEGDYARRYQQQQIDHALQKRKPESRLPAIGVCHWCDHKVEGEARFCGPECSGPWERENVNGA